jgi:RNA polymerase sigma factor (sigma-70 family)
MTGGRFPATPSSAILALKDEAQPLRQRALERLVTYYYAPVFRYLQAKGHSDPADLAQDFFLSSFERGTFSLYDPSRARFRSYLRVCLDRFAVSRLRARGRIKRGGHRVHLPIDWNALGPLPEQLTARVESFEDYFEQEFTRRFLDLVVERLRERCAESGREAHFLLFARTALEPDSELRPSYAELATELDLKETDVTNRLSSMRRLFRRVALEMLEEVTASDDEYRAEARRMLGIDR